MHMGLHSRADRMQHARHSCDIAVLWCIMFRSFSGHCYVRKVLPMACAGWNERPNAWILYAYFLFCNEMITVPYHSIHFEQRLRQSACCIRRTKPLRTQNWIHCAGDCLPAPERMP